MNKNPNKDSIEELLEPLAQQERRHRAPTQLRSQILQRVQETAPAYASDSIEDSMIQQAIDWLTERWWRGVSIGATAAAIPLLSGVLVGYQLSPTEDSLDDPAGAWLASYTVATENSASPANQGETQ